MFYPIVTMGLAERIIDDTLFYNGSCCCDVPSCDASYSFTSIRINESDPYQSH